VVFNTHPLVHTRRLQVVDSTIVSTHCDVTAYQWLVFRWVWWPTGGQVNLHEVDSGLLNTVWGMPATSPNLPPPTTSSTENSQVPSVVCNAISSTKVRLRYSRHARCTVASSSEPARTTVDVVVMDWLIGCLTARQHRKVNLKETGSVV